MGTGKSAVARELGRRLRRPVVEMDAEIERREGMAISRIFADKGEEYFRAQERKLAEELSHTSGRVIACGGGVALDPKNLEALSRHGVLFLLTATPEEILRRLEGQTHRPLLEGADRRRRIEELLTAREPYYRRVKERVETTGLTPGRVADRIIAALERAGGNRNFEAQ